MLTYANMEKKDNQKIFHTVKNKIPQQTAWDEPENLGSISGCALTNPLPCLFSPCLLLGPGFSLVTAGFGFWQGRNLGKCSPAVESSTRPPGPFCPLEMLLYW